MLTTIHITPTNPPPPMLTATISLLPPPIPLQPKQPFPTQISTKTTPNTNYSFLNLVEMIALDGSKVEPIFDFKNFTPQQVQLTSFHLEGIAPQCHIRLTKFGDPLNYGESNELELPADLFGIYPCGQG